MKYEITQQQLQVLVNYLIELPYKKVYQLVDMLQNIPVIEAKDKEDGDKENG